jgi:hypothetical protein
MLANLWPLAEGGKLDNQEKNPEAREIINNKLNLHDAKSRNQTWTTMVTCMHTHHYATHASQKIIGMACYYSWLKSSSRQ